MESRGVVPESKDIDELVIERTKGLPLVERIKDLMIARQLSVGDPLPSEVQLMSMFGASRTAVREALRELAAVAIVSIRHGHGTFAGDLSLTPLAGALVFRARMSMGKNWDAVRELMTVRQALERSLVTEAMRSATDDDIVLLQARLDALKLAAASDGVENVLERDREFHRQLYRPLKNELMLELLDAFWQVYFDIVKLQGSSHMSPDEVVRAHQRLFDAYSAKDHRSLEAAMRDHFTFRLAQDRSSGTRRRR